MINRRKFLAGLVAVPVGAVAGAQLVKEGALFTKSVVSAPKLATKRMEMILVSPSWTRANALHRAMGSPTNVYPVGIGGALSGRGADMIITDDIGPFTSRGRDWWHSQMITRLKPNGIVMEYEQKAPVGLDFNQKAGVVGALTGRNGTNKTASRFYKHPEKVSYKDQLWASANNLKLLMQKHHGFVFEYDRTYRDDAADAARYSAIDPLRLKHQEDMSRWMRKMVDDTAFRMMTGGKV